MTDQTQTLTLDVIEKTLTAYQTAAKEMEAYSNLHGERIMQLASEGKNWRQYIDDDQFDKLLARLNETEAALKNIALDALPLLFSVAQSAAENLRTINYVAVSSVGGKRAQLRKLSDALMRLGVQPSNADS